MQTPNLPLIHLWQVVATALLSVTLYVLWEKWKETPFHFKLTNHLKLPYKIAHEYQLGATTNPEYAYRYLRKRSDSCQRRRDLSGGESHSLDNIMSGYVTFTQPTSR